MSNAARPESGGPAEAPSLQIPSTAGTMPDAPSGLVAPTPNTGEVPAGMGEGNMLDPYFYNQMIRIATVTFTTSDQPGKILYIVTLDPTRMSQQLAYVMAMYLAWGGDYEVGVRAIATNFHAGQIGIVLVPPTLDPMNFTTPQRYSVLPYRVVDVKEPSVVSLIIRDMRPTKYHYTKKPPGALENDPYELSIGGRFMVVVDSPLTTSATGVNKINLAVWMRLQPNFRVSFMVPPVKDMPESVQFPEALLDSLNSSLTAFGSTLSSSPTIAANLIIEAISIKQISSGLFNTSDFAGKNISNLWHGDSKFVPPTWLQRGQVVGSGKEFEVHDIEPQWDIAPKQATLSTFSENPEELLSVVVEIVAYEKTRVIKVKSKVDSPIANGTYVVVIFNAEVGSTGTWPDVTVSIPNDKESFLLFAGLDTKIFSTQTSAITANLATKKFADAIPRGQAALFSVKEAVTELPLFFVKWYRSGLFTSLGRKDRFVFNYSTLSFHFEYFIPEASEFPVNSAMSSNFYAYSALNMVSRKSVTSAGGRRALKSIN